MVGYRLIGPRILPRKLNRRKYLRILLHNLPRLHKNVHLEQRQSTWYLHDGALAHFSATMKHLTRRYGEFLLNNSELGVFAVGVFAAEVGREPKARMYVSPVESAAPGDCGDSNRFRQKPRFLVGHLPQVSYVCLVG